MKKLKTGFFFLVWCSGTVLQVNAAQTPIACPVAQLSVCPAPLDNQLPDVKDMLTWNQQQRVIGFRNDYRSYFYAGDVFKAAKAAPLSREARDLSAVNYQYQGQNYTLSDYLKRNNATGMMVIKDGKIVWDYYSEGNTNTTLWTSRSVGKAVVSTLVGIALKEGKIASLDDAIIKYNPDVRGTAWEQVTIRQLMQHTSGVTWNEDYTNPKSDFALFTECEANKQTYDCVNRLVNDPQRKAYAKPGQVWSYSSGGAWLLGDTLEKAISKSLAQYLEEKVWQPYGMVHDGVWQSYQTGKHSVGAHGFNATLEDWGKFGVFIMNEGVLPNGTKVLPDNWVADARTWVKAKNSISAEHPEGIYGYQWWNNSVPADSKDVGPKQGLTSADTLWALGIFGQMMVVNPQQKLVIVQWSVWPKAKPEPNAEPLEASLMFNAIANNLAK
ncbi:MULTISPECIES: serine hydrolase [unclassified Serratia (in: enterobacteria)]|uniref:serine hydrolase domain-containing protein n=1 Tax=unclassified Serratia (in: enterobacteria) TaxID=2647522 RepID=UPI00068FAB65|nr:MULTISPECIES: serine hydrolase [unclassified Serratia (in: enterobacteria)]